MRDSDKRKTLDERINSDQPIGAYRLAPRACSTCAMAHGLPPWEDGPKKGSCLAYPYAEGQCKPDSVLFNGSDCERYVRDRNVSKS